MIVATHRVVGVLEWPAGSEPSTEVLATLQDNVVRADTDPSSRVLSLRLPVADSTAATLLTADVVQLRRDLQQLFHDFAG